MVKFGKPLAHKMELGRVRRRLERKSKICKSSYRSGNDQEMYDQMERDLIDLSQETSEVQPWMLVGIWT